MIAVAALVIGSVLCIACAFWPEDHRYANRIALGCGVTGALLIGLSLAVLR